MRLVPVNCSTAVYSCLQAEKDGRIALDILEGRKKLVEGRFSILGPSAAT